MRNVFCTIAALAFYLTATTAHAETHRVCRSDVYGNRTCQVITVQRRTTHIMGIPAGKYMRGVRQGRCMPSPSGACGGG